MPPNRERSVLCILINAILHYLQSHFIIGGSLELFVARGRPRLARCCYVAICLIG